MKKSFPCSVSEWKKIGIERGYWIYFQEEEAKIKNSGRLLYQIGAKETKEKILQLIEEMITIHKRNDWELLTLKEVQMLIEEIIKIS